MARACGQERVTAETAQRRLRDSYTDAIKEHRETHGSGETTKILDVGCSVGCRRVVSDAFPNADVVGLDLSPHMLAVAWRAIEGASAATHVGAQEGEDTKYPDGTFDIVSLAFVIHECPESATAALMRRRIACSSRAEPS